METRSRGGVPSEDEIRWLREHEEGASLETSTSPHLDKHTEMHTEGQNGACELCRVEDRALSTLLSSPIVFGRLPYEIVPAARGSDSLLVVMPKPCRMFRNLFSIFVRSDSRFVPVLLGRMPLIFRRICTKPWSNSDIQRTSCIIHA